jgi:hypothetical protein
MLSVVMLNVIVLSDVTLSVVAPPKWADDTTLEYQLFEKFKSHVATNISEHLISFKFGLRLFLPLPSQA